MAGSRIIRWLVPVGFGLLPLTAAGAFAQANQEPQDQGMQAQPEEQSQGFGAQQPQQQEQGSQAQQQSQRTQGQRQVSPKTQQALIRLHALSQSRAEYANAAAQSVTDPDVSQFLEQRAAEYQQSDRRLTSLADSYGVNLESPQLKQKADDIKQYWDAKLQELQRSERPQAASAALQTFVQRNDQAISDLRTLRGDVQEEQVRQLINQRIASLEQESTRAQSLEQRIQQKQGGQQGMQQGGQEGMQKQQEQQPMQNQPSQQY